MTGIAFRPFPGVGSTQATVLLALPFPPGTFWDGQGLNIGGHAAQVDAFRHYVDGSIRHAGIALVVPAMAIGQITSAPIDQGLPRSDAASIVPLATDATVALTIAATPTAAAVALPVIDVNAALQAAIAANKVEFLRHGPLVSEGRFRLPVLVLSNDFELVFDIATFADATPTRVDITFAREQTIVDLPVQADSSQITSNLVYDVVITSGGQSVSYSLPGCCFQGVLTVTDPNVGGTMSVTNVLGGILQPGMNLNGHGPTCATFGTQVSGTPGGVGIWNVEQLLYSTLGVGITDNSGGANIIWAAGFGGTNSGFGCGEIGSHALGQTWCHVINEQQIHVVHDTAWLRRCGVMVQDDSVGVEATLLSTATAFPPVIPLDHGGIIQDMGTTGDQSQLGPQPDNVAIWVISQEPSDYINCAHNGAQAGSIPMYFRDSKTGYWVSVADYPSLWVGCNVNDWDGPVASPLAAFHYQSQLNGWGVDVSHNGDYFFTLWALTGRLKWLDGLEVEPQACHIAADPSGGRGGPPSSGNYGTGVVLPSSDIIQGVGETRGQAWTVRYVVLAAAWTVDWHAHDLELNTTWVANNLVAVRSFMNAIQTVPAKQGTPYQQGELYMWMGGDYSYGQPPVGILSTFSQAFVVEVLSWANRLGFECYDVIKAMVGYLSGPMTHSAVFPAWYGGQYEFPIADNNSTIFTTYASCAAWCISQGQFTEADIALPFPGKIVDQDNIIWSEVRGALSMALTESTATGTLDERCQVGLAYIEASTIPVNANGLGLNPYNFPRHAALK